MHTHRHWLSIEMFVLTGHSLKITYYTIEYGLYHFCCAPFLDIAVVAAAFIVTLIVCVK